MELKLKKIEVDNYECIEKISAFKLNKTSTVSKISPTNTVCERQNAGTKTI